MWNSDTNEPVPIVDEVNTRTPLVLYLETEVNLSNKPSKWNNPNFEDLLKNIRISPVSQRAFEISNDNVAFVGAYNIEENKLYLHPLVPWTEGDYETAEFKPSKGAPLLVEPNEKRQSVGVDPEPIKHETNNSSHTQILGRYGFNSAPLVGKNSDPQGSDLPNFIGFRVTKKSITNINPDRKKNDERPIAELREEYASSRKVNEVKGYHVLNVQSATLNNNKFKAAEAAGGNWGRSSSYLPDQWIKFLKMALAKTIPEQIQYP